jgi:hypothetical protein
MSKELSSLLVDPPEGWKYGFPKRLPKEGEDPDFNLNEWIVQNGYPQKLIDTYGEYFYVRMIETDYEFEMRSENGEDND